MTHEESHRREKQSFWNGILVSMAIVVGWVFVALLVVRAFGGVYG